MTEDNKSSLPDDEPTEFLRVDEKNLAVLEHNGKHASLEVLCFLMDDILVGRAAESVLSGDLPDQGCLWVAPHFGWMEPAIDVGLKNVNNDGDSLLMPVRLEWDTSMLLLAPDAEAESSWHTSSMGNRADGKVQVSTSFATDEPESELDDSFVPVSATVPVESEPALRRRLEGLVEAGKLAFWEFSRLMEPRVHSMIRRAHASACIEISEFIGSELSLLDDTAIESVVDDFMYGNEDRKSKLYPILEKVLLPQSMQKVDPLRYINVAIRRDTAEAVRQKVGDNREGRKIRKVAKELDMHDIDAVVSALNELYPSAQIGFKRVRDALTVSPDPMAGRWSNHRAEDGSEIDFVDN